MIGKNKKPSKTAVNSVLIRRPIKRCFWLFLLPTVSAFLIGFLWPFVQGIYLSFCKFRITSKAEFIGFDNYINVFKDEAFLHAFWYTALFAIVSVLLINIFAFIVAYILTSGMRGANIFRTAFFMPNLIGGIVLGTIWVMIFNGILDKYGETILSKSEYGFWGLIILMCWQQIGYMMIIYIAGLQSVPEDIMEAAKIDGANKWKTLIHVTIPNIMPSITTCLFLAVTNGFKLFDQNLALTNGKPIVDGVRKTEMLALNIYHTFYGQNASGRGRGQAKAVVFFILVAIISLTQLKITKSKEVQQ